MHYPPYPISLLKLPCWLVTEPSVVLRHLSEDFDLPLEQAEVLVSASLHLLHLREISVEEYQDWILQTLMTEKPSHLWGLIYNRLSPKHGDEIFRLFSQIPPILGSSRNYWDNPVIDCDTSLVSLNKYLLCGQIPQYLWYKEMPNGVGQIPEHFLKLSQAIRAAAPLTEGASVTLPGRRWMLVGNTVSLTRIGRRSINPHTPEGRVEIINGLHPKYPKISQFGYRHWPSPSPNLAIKRKFVDEFYTLSKGLTK